MNSGPEYRLNAERIPRPESRDPHPETAVSIRFLCSNCSQLLKIATRKAGTVISCPKCGYSQPVPPESLAFATQVVSAKSGTAQQTLPESPGSRFAYKSPPSGKIQRQKGSSPPKEVSELDNWLNDFWSDNERLYQKENSKNASSADSETKFADPSAVPLGNLPPIPAPAVIADDFLDGLIPPAVPAYADADSVPPQIRGEFTDDSSGQFENSAEVSVPPVIEDSASRFDNSALGPPIIEPNYADAFDSRIDEIIDGAENPRTNEYRKSAGVILEQSPVAAEQIIQAPPVIAPERPQEFEPNVRLSSREMQELLYNRDLRGPSKFRKVLVYAFLHLLTLSLGIGIGLGISHFLATSAGGNNQVVGPVVDDQIRVDGMLAYMNAEGISQADNRAIFILFPAESPPEHPVSCIGLRPQDRFEEIQKENSQKIVDYGGYYERTDERGSMAITIPKPGSYYVLMISAHAVRPLGSEVDEKTVQTLEKYIIRPQYLIGQFKYTMKKLELSHDSRKIEHNFFRNEADLSGF